MVKLSEVKSRQLFDFFKSVHKSISVYEQFSRSLGHVQVVLEELLYSEQCLVIERIYRALLEYFLQESLAQGSRQMIDQPSDTQIIIGNDILVSVEYLADFERYLSFLERTRKIPDALDNSTDADIYSCIEFA